VRRRGTENREETSGAWNYTPLAFVGLHVRALEAGEFEVARTIAVTLVIIVVRLSARQRNGQHD